MTGKTYAYAAAATTTIIIHTLLYVLLTYILTTPSSRNKNKMLQFANHIKVKLTHADVTYLQRSCHEINTSIHQDKTSRQLRQQLTSTNNQYNQ